MCLGLALTPALPARCVRSPSTITSKKKRGHDVHAQSIEKRSHSESLSRECRALQPGASSATETFWRMAAWSAQRPSSGAQSTFAQRDARSIATFDTHLRWDKRDAPLSSFFPAFFPPLRRQAHCSSAGRPLAAWSLPATPRVNGTRPVAWVSSRSDRSSNSLWLATSTPPPSCHRHGKLITRSTPRMCRRDMVHG